MPIHDWTKVDAGIFHHFHLEWIAAISNVLNDGLLPEGYYALAEHVTRPFGPDVLTLQTNEVPLPNGATRTAGVIAVLEHPPKVRVAQQSDAELYAKKANRRAIRHVSDDHLIAMIEILSPGNKSGRHAIDSFLDKVWAAFDQGIHLLLVDLFPADVAGSAGHPRDHLGGLGRAASRGSAVDAGRLRFRRAAPGVCRAGRRRQHADRHAVVSQ